MTAKIKVPDADHQIAKYLGGVSVNQLAKELGFSRSAVVAFLRDHGVEIRGRSDAERTKWILRRQLPSYRDAVERQCESAWRAATGRRRSLDERCAAAATRSRMISPDETLIAAEIAKLGGSVVPQLAIGPYNVDLAFEKCAVAVEVQRGDWFRVRSRARQLERLEYLLNSRWAVLFAYCPNGVEWKTGRRRSFDARRVAAKCIALRNLARRDPSIWGKYGVIDRHGEPHTPRGFQLDRWPRIPGF